VEILSKDRLSALEIVFKDEPAQYVKAVLRLMPRDIAIENVMSDMSDENLTCSCSKFPTTCA
jgi:hypothetical protein